MCAPTVLTGRPEMVLKPLKSVYKEPSCSVLISLQITGGEVSLGNCVTTPLSLWWWDDIYTVVDSNDSHFGYEDSSSKQLVYILCMNGCHLGM